LPQVTAQRCAAQHVAGRRLEQLADLRARDAAGVAVGDQRLACLEHERLHLLRSASEHRGDLAVAQVAQLRQHEGGPLILGQPRQIGHQLAQLGAPPDLLGQVVESVLRQLGWHGVVPSRRQHRAAAVARDREQPRPHRRWRAPAAQRAMRAQERLLQRLLAVLAAAEHVRQNASSEARWRS
jgi:hypothetical protein